MIDVNRTWLLVPIVTYAMAFTTPSRMLDAQQRVVSDARRSNAVDPHVAEHLFALPVTITFDRIPLSRAINLVLANVGVRAQYNTAVVAHYTTPVTLHAQHVPLSETLTRILAGTTLRVVPLSGTSVGIVEITANASSGMTFAGTIAGHVTDAKMAHGIQGANISLDGATRGVVSGDDGTYRIPDVPVGTHMVTVKCIGYARQTRTVAVADGQMVTVDIALESSATPLNQIVVTGTVIPTELKAVPNAITVITAKDIEQRGITRIDQLFRGDVPGLFAPNQGSLSFLDAVATFSRGATSFGASAGIDANIRTTNPIKTYIDGVELADPKYLSQIDPKSIERIEILTGPQASTIYGSNAINGVMQIFTKRGTSNTPQLTLNLLSGWVENNFSNARTPQHDYSAQLNGIEGRLSYNAGGSWNYIGPWSPAKQTTRLGNLGGARLDWPTVFGRVTVDATFRRDHTQNLQRGSELQTYTGYRETGWYTRPGNLGLSDPTLQVLTGQTLGVTMGYAPTTWWSHELVLGQDVSDVESRSTARGYMALSDTTLILQQSQTNRRSLRYAMTTRVPVTPFAQTTITGGADAWQSVNRTLTDYSPTLTGSLATNIYTSLERQPAHNTGAFLQTQLSVQGRLFLTYGLRAEWNPNYGVEAEPNYAPRYGIAYTQEIGSLTTKLRASYGRSTRPPLPNLKASQTAANYFPYDWPDYSQYYTNFNIYLANPQLGPEYQQGGEGGLEMYFGTNGSLVITRYNQTVDGLIVAPKVDSIRSITPCQSSGCSADQYDANGYGYFYQYQYLNIASIRNQGWELQGQVNTGPFTTKGTYSWTKSRSIGVDPRYRAYYANTGLAPGRAFAYSLPEHTWAVGVTYAHAQNTVMINVTGIGQETVTQDDFYFQHITPLIRLVPNRLTMGFSRYLSFNNGYALADVMASHRFSARVEAQLQVRNLGNTYKNDYWSQYASLGRQTRLGMRVKL